MGLGSTRAPQANRVGGFLEGLAKAIKVAEDVTKSPLFDLVKDRLPKFGVELTDEQKATLDEHYAQLTVALEESQTSEQTGRAAKAEEPVEGDTD